MKHSKQLTNSARTQGQWLVCCMNCSTGPQGEAKTPPTTEVDEPPRILYKYSKSQKTLLEYVKTSDQMIGRKTDKEEETNSKTKFMKKLKGIRESSIQYWNINNNQNLNGQKKGGLIRWLNRGTTRALPHPTTYVRCRACRSRPSTQMPTLCMCAADINARWWKKAEQHRRIMRGVVLYSSKTADNKNLSYWL